MKITSKGQVTIPQDLRQKHGLLPETGVTFISEKSGLRLVKAKLPSGRGRKMAERLAGSGHKKYTTAQVMRMTRG